MLSAYYFFHLADRFFASCDPVAGNRHNGYFKMF